MLDGISTSMALCDITLQASTAGPSLDNALVNSVQIYAGHVPSCVLNDPVDDM